MENTKAHASEKLQQGHSPAAASGSAPAGKPKSKLAILVICAVVALLAVGIYSGVHSRVAADTVLADAATQSSIPSVRVAYPQAGEQLQQVDLPGNVQAFTDTPIYARTSGYLRHWYVDIGAHVHQGELMAEIETPELDQQLQQAQAEVKTAQANVEIADITSKRWQNLLAKDAVSQQETDQAKSDFAARQATLSSAEANVRRLEQMQGFEKVVAPFDGVVTARNIDIGALVAAGANSMPKELFHVSALNRLRVYVAVPEAYANAVTDGGKVNLTETDRSDETFQGVMVRNSNTIDPQSRTLNLEVDLENSKGHLLPGAYVFVHLRLPANPHSVTLPSNALLFRAEGLRAAVIRQNHVVLAPISIGHDYGNKVEITSGLTTQDAIVLDPPDSLAAGEEVKVITTGKQGPA